MDFSAGFVVMSAVNEGSEASSFYPNMIVLPLDKFLDAFAEPEAIAELVRERSGHLIREWTLLNGTPDSAGSRTQTEKLFTLFEHTWKTYGNTQHRSQCELQVLKILRILQDTHFFSPPQSSKRGASRTSTTKYQRRRRCDSTMSR